MPAPGYPAPAFDGITEIWFDDWEDHNAFFGSANYKNRVQPDERNLLDHDSVVAMVTDEKTVI